MYWVHLDMARVYTIVAANMIVLGFQGVKVMANKRFNGSYI